MHFGLQYVLLVVALSRHDLCFGKALYTLRLRLRLRPNYLAFSFTPCHFSLSHLALHFRFSPCRLNSSRGLLLRRAVLSLGLRLRRLDRRLSLNYAGLEHYCVQLADSLEVRIIFRKNNVGNVKLRDGKTILFKTDFDFFAQGGRNEIELFIYLEYIDIVSLYD